MAETTGGPAASSLTFYFPRSISPRAIRARLNAVARALGYGGPTGRGAAAAMLLAIAEGELALVLLPDEQRAWAARFLRAQAAQQERPSWREALWALADSLDDAAAREAGAEEKPPLPAVFISVANGRATVGWLELTPDGSLSFCPAANAVELADEAADAVYSAGGGLNISGLYPCPSDLAAKAKRPGNGEGD